LSRVTHIVISGQEVQVSRCYKAQTRNDLWCIYWPAPADGRHHDIVMRATYSCRPLWPYTFC